jgi:integrase
VEISAKQRRSGRSLCSLKEAGVSDINFHALRHTFATRALEAGMDIKVLSSILGHAQASTTLNLYAHALPDHKKQSMEKMSSFYGSAFNEYNHTEARV